MSTNTAEKNDPQKFEITSKSDIVKVIKAVDSHLNSESVDQELYEYLEAESGMKDLMENVMNRYSYKEFINMVGVVAPNHLEMWEDIYQEFSTMNEEMEESASAS